MSDQNTIMRFDTDNEFNEMLPKQVGEHYEFVGHLHGAVFAVGTRKVNIAKMTMHQAAQLAASKYRNFLKKETKAVQAKTTAQNTKSDKK